MTTREESIFQKVFFLFSVNKYWEAEKELYQLLSLNPENAEAISWLGYAKAKNGRIDEGISDLRHAISLSPEEAHFHYLLSVVHYNNDKIDAADECIHNALRIRADQDEYIAMSACVLLVQGRESRAISEANRALAIDPENLTAYNVLALAFARTGREQQSEEAIRTALRIDPLNEYYHSLLGQRKLADGNAPDAFSSFQEALRLNPVESHIKKDLATAKKSHFRLYKIYIDYCNWRDSKDSREMSALDSGFMILIALLFLTSLTPSPSTLLKILCAIVVLPMVYLTATEPIANLLLSTKAYWRYTIEPDKRWLIWPTATGIMILVLGLVLVPIYDNDLGHQAIVLGTGTIILFGGFYRRLDQKRTIATTIQVVLIMIFGIISLIPSISGDDALLINMFGLTTLTYRWFADRPRYR